MIRKFNTFNESHDNKGEKLFDYLISIGFDKSILKDKQSKQDLLVFRHNEFYREQLIAYPTYELNYENYQNTKKFLDDWGYLTDEELEVFNETFLS